MFPFPRRPVRPDAQGRYPWTGWRTTDVLCALLSFLAAIWLGHGHHWVWAGSLAITGALSVLSAWWSWADRILAWSRGAVAAKALQKSLGS